MGGGLMQLVAYGAQDIYITGNPQITFFKIVYRRHTNFAMESVQQSLTGNNVSSTISKKECSSIISRNGDLITNLYITTTTPGVINGDSIIDEAMIEIGGQKIDKHYKEWMQIWAELTTPESKALAYKNMTGCFSHNLNKLNQVISQGNNMIQIPLIFWFCRNPGLALPLIALQYHEVKIKFTLGLSSDIGTDTEIKLFVDYIYLDTDERRRFAQVSHEYLIEQLQRIESDNSDSHNLNLNHPVKELIWTTQLTNQYGTAKLQLNGHDRFTEQEEEYFQLRQPYDYHTSVPGTNIDLQERPQLQLYNTETDNILRNIKTIKNSGNLSNTTDTILITNTNLIFNTGTDPQFKIGDIILVTSQLSGRIITQLFTIIGGSNGNYNINSSTNTVNYIPSDDSNGSIRLLARIQDPIPRCCNLKKRINVYSFALQPEEHQPSGTCNFSRIDNAKLIFNSNAGTTTDDNVNIYATNYNVLRIMSGMGGLAYSN
jgi:hypothetical protein